MKTADRTNNKASKSMVDIDHKRLNPAIFMVLLAVLLCFGIPHRGYAEGPRQFTSAEQLFFQLLNKTRENPLAMIKAYGMSSSDIVSQHPALASVLEEGVEPLGVNDALNAAAASHCADMLKRGYYSHRSPEGWAPKDRIVSQGYLPVYSDEDLGILAFYNYMAPEDAARRLFGNMLKSELGKAEDVEGLRLLNPHAKELGLRILPGTMVVSGKVFNVYLVVCELGQEATEEEIGLLHLINQAREVPTEVAQAYGIDPEKLFEDHPELVDILDGGLHPLQPNVLLREAASGHAIDMLENQYFSSTSADGRTYEDRIRDTGYESLPVGESIGDRPLCDGIDGAEAVRRVFRDWFLDELADNQGQGCVNILNPDFREIGIGSAMGYAPELTGICGDEIALFVADLGAGNGPEPGVMGLVYQDMDGDGLYTLGEGVGGLRVYVVTPERVVAQAITDKTGGIWLAVGPGDYNLVLRDSNGELLMRRHITVAEEPMNIRIAIGPCKEGLTQEAN